MENKKYKTNFYKKFNYIFKKNKFKKKNIKMENNK